jgi:hypothetical protein
MGVMDVFCRPVVGGVWETKLASGFGAFTPCLVDTVVITVSNLALLFSAVYRIRALLYSSSSGNRFKVSRCWGHYFAILLAFVCAVEPIVQITLSLSAVNLDGETTLPPFEVRNFFPFIFFLIVTDVMAEMLVLLLMVVMVMSVSNNCMCAFL